jgi:2-polyprenyl-3-methyl-5-hydroxy-6-metoxy-1,4-benzoquinol methylase
MGPDLQAVRVAADVRWRNSALSFEALMRNRSAEEYADFVLPLIRKGDRLLDVGCGPGSITLGLAQVASHVTGVATRSVGSSRSSI